jgi:8-oxo-dGTP pyrophosphatase MutT (NUDIX family)
MTMVCFDSEGTRFNYRVAGIALREQQVLLNRFEDQNYWFLPGGRVELGENSQDGLRREMREELQEKVHVGRLLWIVESFFNGVGDMNYHELGLYYLMHFPSQSPVFCTKKQILVREGQTQVMFEWVPLAELEKITLYPPFLVQGLRNLPEQTIHLLDGPQRA